MARRDGLSEVALAVPILAALVLSYVLLLVSGRAFTVVLVMIAICILRTASQVWWLRRGSRRPRS